MLSIVIVCPKKSQWLLMGLWKCSYVLQFCTDFYHHCLYKKYVSQLLEKFNKPNSGYHFLYTVHTVY